MKGPETMRSAHESGDRPGLHSGAAAPSLPNAPPRNRWILAPLLTSVVAILCASAVAIGCGGGDKATMGGAAAPGAPVPPSAWPADDHSMCNWRGKTDVDVSEVAGLGSIRPNVRRVFRIVGDQEHVHRVIICREVDTNLDGIKDVVRYFNDKGEPIREEADRDFDGRVDAWTLFVDGHVAEEQEDTNKDGKPDVWKYYSDGALTRIKRDRNFDGKPDQWEIYTRGRLERVGVDDTFDGHVDRWDRDDQLRADQDEIERKTREAMAAAQDAGGGNKSASDAGASADTGK